MTMQSHQSSAMKSDTWLTPPEILKPLGAFDLDPCTPPRMPWRTAETMWTRADGALLRPWVGRVWLNPPYSKQAVRWLQRMAAHGNGIALMFARTGADWFFETVWNATTAKGALFLRHYLYFCDAGGKRAPFNAGAPSVLVAYSVADAAFLERSGLDGRFIAL